MAEDAFIEDITEVNISRRSIEQISEI
jgi:hypothetical protein